MVSIFSGDSRNSYSWGESYRLQEDEPYDCSLVYELSKDIYPEVGQIKTSIFSEDVFGPRDYVDRFFEETREDSIRYWRLIEYYEYTESRIAEQFDQKQPDFVFVDKSMKSLSQYDMYALLIMAKYGSKVIFSHYFYREEYEILFDFTVGIENTALEEDSIQTLQFEGQDYSFPKGAAGRCYFKPSSSGAFLEHNEYLFDQDGVCRGMKFDVGKKGGTIHFLSAPIIFTNYYMLKGDHYKISESLLSRNSSKALLWGNDYTSTVRSEKHDKDPFAELKFIREHESLSWALFLGLGCLVFFMALRIKRPQRFVPIVEQPQNTSLQFIDILTVLYLQRGNHYEIAAKKINYFLEGIRSKYHISTKELDESFVATLLRKTTVSEDDLWALIHQIKEIRTSKKVDERSLKQLIARIKTFKSHI
jgi:hypothetical protein